MQRNGLRIERSGFLSAGFPAHTRNHYWPGKKSCSGRLLDGPSFSHAFLQVPQDLFQPLARNRLIIENLWVIVHTQRVIRLRGQPLRECMRIAKAPASFLGPKNHRMAIVHGRMEVATVQEKEAGATIVSVVIGNRALILQVFRYPPGQIHSKRFPAQFSELGLLPVIQFLIHGEIWPNRAAPINSKKEKTGGCIR